MKMDDFNNLSMDEKHFLAGFTTFQSNEEIQAYEESSINKMMEIFNETSEDDREAHMRFIIKNFFLKNSILSYIIVHMFDGNMEQLHRAENLEEIATNMIKNAYNITDEEDDTNVIRFPGGFNGENNTD